MKANVTILVEILRKINYNINKEKNMPDKKAKAPNVVSELGAKNGYKTGGVVIEATDPFKTQTVTVRGTKAMRADKKPVKAKWY